MCSRINILSESTESLPFVLLLPHERFGQRKGLAMVDCSCIITVDGSCVEGDISTGV
jgi:hypothetical protein